MVEAFTLACPDPERSNLWKSSYIQLKFYSGSSGLALQRMPMSKQKRPLISFVIVGCMKSGTTSLYDHIMQHPMCRRGKQKEFHFCKSKNTFFRFKYLTVLILSSFLFFFLSIFFFSSRLEMESNEGSGF